ncbi:MAG TPA: AbrB/MazE/SpoVT family DNA-binding domain-containing protein [Verrucomicrobiae bacterium]|jgi:AbrB family looped-hinge helix DNA binding protein
MKNGTVEIDKAGRIILPKSLREQLHLLPGDKLSLSLEGSGFKLEPEKMAGEYVKKGSVLVLTGGFKEALTTENVNDLILHDRESINRKLRKPPKK